MRVFRLLAVAMLLSACGGDDDIECNADMHCIGFNVALSGELSGLGSTGQDVVRLAVERINAAGGVAGKQLQLVTVDNQTSATVAVAEARRLLDAGVVAMLGPEISSGLAQVIPLARDGRVPVIGCCSTAQSIAALDDGGFAFRVAPSDDYQAVAMALALQRSGDLQALVLHQNDNYGSELAAAFQAAYEAQGGTVTQTLEFAPGLDAVTADGLIDQIDDANAELVVLIAFAGDGQLLIQSWHQKAVAPDLEWFGPDGIKEADFIIPNSPGFNGIRGTAPTHQQGAAYDALTAEFMTEYDRDIRQDSYMAHYWDQVFLLALALEATDGMGGVPLRDALLAVSHTGTTYTPIDFVTARDAIADGTDIDYQGASGPVNFDVAGEVAGDYEVWEITQSQFVEDSRITAEEIEAEITNTASM